MAQLPSALTLLNNEIVGCYHCPRLVLHREQIGLVQRRAYRGEVYWSRAVPGFGDPEARVLLVGLAPGAHGANRTGRMFTGDRSGEFLFRALWEAGFANQPHGTSREDGLELHDAYITASVRCVPPDNKPTNEELITCRSYLIRELKLLQNTRVVVALGQIAMQAYLATLQAEGLIASRSGFLFGHGRIQKPYPGGPILVTSYHPSQQNTSTGKLTAEMLRGIFLRVKDLLLES